LALRINHERSNLWHGNCKTVVGRLPSEARISVRWQKSADINQGPVGSDGFLSQTFTGSGTLYNVSFWLYNDGGTPNDFTVYWNGVDVGPDLLNVGAFAYTEYAGTLSGNVGANTITFGYRQDPAYFGLDDVIVTNAVPEPGSLMLLGSGILGLAGAIRRKLGA
jgi:PEP-CTERM motif